MAFYSYLSTAKTYFILFDRDLKRNIVFYLNAAQCSEGPIERVYVDPRYTTYILESKNDVEIIFPVFDFILPS